MVETGSGNGEAGAGARTLGVAVVRARDMCRPCVLGALPSQYRTLRIISRCGLNVFYALREEVLIVLSLVACGV